MSKAKCGAPAPYADQLSAGPGVKASGPLDTSTSEAPPSAPDAERLAEIRGIVAHHFRDYLPGPYPYAALSMSPGYAARLLAWEEVPKLTDALEAAQRENANLTSDISYRSQVSLTLQLQSEQWQARAEAAEAKLAAVRNEVPAVAAAEFDKYYGPDRDSRTDLETYIKNAIDAALEGEQK